MRKTLLTTVLSLSAMIILEESQPVRAESTKGTTSSFQIEAAQQENDPLDGSWCRSGWCGKEGRCCPLKTD